MNPYIALWGRLKAAVFPARASSTFLLPRTDRNYAHAVGDGLSSNIIMATLFWIMRTFPEAPVVVEQHNRAEQSWELDPGHALTARVSSPNDAYDGVLLMMATILDYSLNGNTYWWKIRGRDGSVQQLWWLPSAFVEPVWPKDARDTYVSGYAYDPNQDDKGIVIKPTDIVHYRFGLDPHNVRKGISPLRTLLREVFTDEEASNYSAAILANLGVPSVVLASKKDLNAEETKAAKQRYQETFGGDNRGDVFVSSTDLTIQTISLNPQQLNLRDLRKIPEERVSATLGVPAVVVGYGAGLDRSTFSNMREAREAAYESGIIPTQRIFAAAMQHQLLPDFGATDGLRVRFDTSGVRVLQEDQDALHVRIREDVKAGIVTIEEGRLMLGIPAEANGTFLRPLNLLEVLAGSQGRTEVSTGTIAGTAGLPGPVERKALVDLEDEPWPDYEEWGESYAKASRQEQRFLDGLLISRQHLERVYAREIDNAFGALGREVEAAYRDLAKEPVTAGRTNGHAKQAGEEEIRITHQIMRNVNIDGAGERYLEPVFQRMSARIYSETLGQVAGLLGVELNVNLDDPIAQGIIRQGATGFRLVNVVATVQQSVQETLALARGRGLNIDATARLIRESVGPLPASTSRIMREAEENGWSEARVERELQRASQSRGRTIARTETGTAQNRSTIGGYQQSEVVESIRIHDGSGCGWVTHRDSDVADGSIRTFEAFAAQPLSHPNCVRVGSPVRRQ